MIVGLSIGVLIGFILGYWDGWKRGFWIADATWQAAFDGWHEILTKEILQ